MTAIDTAVTAAFLTFLSAAPPPGPSTSPTPTGANGATGGMRLHRVITGGLSPKSVVHSGNGLFFAQNMMYRHTVSVYDRSFRLVKQLPDTVTAEELGLPRKHGTYQGSPVEAAFSHGGRYAWVSNYQMYGRGFNNPGDDTCLADHAHDPSYVYRIDTSEMRITHAVKVGSVPKYVAATPDGRWVLVSNWAGKDLSVVDTATNQEVRRLKIGPHPRGIAVDSSGSRAYIAVMSSLDVAVLDLKTWKLGWLRGVGNAPRHLSLDPAGKFLYVTLNGEGRVAKVDLVTRRVVARVETGLKPRSQAISGDGRFLYVVNYESGTVSKVRTADMRVVQTIKTRKHPIGVTYDPEPRQVWVACYSGSLMVFQD
jgi:YVTN family beta-propeller protein